MILKCCRSQQHVSWCYSDMTYLWQFAAFEMIRITVHFEGKLGSPNPAWTDYNSISQDQIVDRSNRKQGVLVRGKCFPHGLSPTWNLALLHRYAADPGLISCCLWVVFSNCSLISVMPNRVVHLKGAVNLSFVDLSWSPRLYIYCLLTCSDHDFFLDYANSYFSPRPKTGIHLGLSCRQTHFPEVYNLQASPGDFVPFLKREGR